MSSLPKQMHAWRKHKASKTPTYDTIPVPPCPASGYLVQLQASGVCHSDDILLNVPPTLLPPYMKDVYTLGHEGCGVVVQVGPDVQGHGHGHEVFDVGDRVATYCVPGCGDGGGCPECSRDLSQLCVRGVRYGLGHDGFYASYVAVGPGAMVKVPDGVSSEVAAVATDAVLTAYHGVVKRAEVKKHETVVIFGLGGLGFNALQIVHRAIGARVIVSDVRQERLDEAVKLGVPKEDVVPVGKSVREFVQENGLADQIDTTLDFVGMEQTVEDAQSIVRPGGKVLCAGLFADKVSIPLKEAARKRISILFTYGGQRQDLVECLDLIAKGVITPQVETASVKDFPAVLQDLCDGKIKARMALLPDVDQ